MSYAILMPGTRIMGIPIVGTLVPLSQYLCAVPGMGVPVVGMAIEGTHAPPGTHALPIVTRRGSVPVRDGLQLAGVGATMPTERIPAMVRARKSLWQ